MAGVRSAGLYLDHYGRGFFTFKVVKTQFRGLCLSPLSRTLGQLSKYEIKKRDHFIFRHIFSLKIKKININKLLIIFINLTLPLC